MKLYLKKQLIIAAFLYFGCMAIGYTAGWTAPVIPKLQDPDQSPIPLLSDGEASWVGSVTFLGAIIGANVGGSLSNMKGRKPCLQLGGAIMMLSYIVIALSANLAMLIVGRLFVGIGVSFIYVLVVVYFTETASTNIRGILLTATGIFGVLGTLLAYTIGPYVSYAATGYIGLFISMTFCLGTIFIPETPVFYVLRGKENEAKCVLTQLGRINDIEELLATKLIGRPKSRKQEWLEMFSVKTNRKAFFIIAVLIGLQQASGSVSIIFFSTNIFRSMDSSIDPSVSTILIGLTQFFSSIVTPMFIERSGRKLLLLISTAVCSLSLALLGVYFYLDSHNDSTSDKLHWLPLTTLVVFLLSYSIGFAIVPEAYMGEMFESNVRAPGSALIATLGWIVSFTSTTCYGYIISSLGGHVMFWMYSGVCATAFIFTAFCVPETKGKSLADIQYMLSR